MKIGEFVKLLNTTKDTVRYYEELHLIKPIQVNKLKQYSEKDVVDFKVILELKSYGMSLKDIQFIFKLKAALGCGDQVLIQSVFEQLTKHIDLMKCKEEELRNRRLKLQNELEKIKELL